MSDLQDIHDEHLRIIGKGKGDRFPIMSGVVVGVDVESMTASVALTVDGDGTGDTLVTTSTQINVILNNTLGWYMLPAEGSDCLVMEVDGPGTWELLKASEYTKISGKVGDNSAVMDGSSITVTTGSNTLVMNSSGVTVNANVATLKAADINIGAGDAFANHLTQWEALNAALSFMKADLNTFISKWNAFCLAFVPYNPASPSTPGMPLSLGRSTVTPHDYNFAGSKLLHLHCD